MTSACAVANESCLGFSLEEATIGEMQRAMSSGRLSCAKLVDLYLARVAAYDTSGPRLSAYILVNPNAREEATALDRERAERGPRGPLHGIPVLLKDNIDTADMPTSNGSVLMKGAIPPDDATITRLLREAGALIIGKAALGDFARGSYDTASGQTVNPYNFKRQTGGSSSGPGAAVAANLCAVAIGTDTSASVRQPAAFNGIVGMRPTTGLISRDGIAPKNLSFDTAGPMARTVTDLAQLLSVIAARDPADDLNMQVWDEMERRYRPGAGHIDFTQFLDPDALKGKRVGVLRDFFGGDPDIVAMAQAALADLRRLGAELVDIKLDQAFMKHYFGSRWMRDLADARFRPDLEAYLATFADPSLPKTVVDFLDRYEAGSSSLPFPADGPVIQLLQASLTMSTDTAEYRKLIDEILPQATVDKRQIFVDHRVDVLVCPYHTAFAPPIKNPKFSIEDPTYVKSTVPEPATLGGYSSEGFPCAVVPMGFGKEGLPMNLGFFARPYEDGQVVGYAFAYEQATRHRRPSPLVPPLTAESII